MRHIIQTFCLVFIAVSCATLYAKSPVRLGATAGLNLSSFYGDDSKPFGVAPKYKSGVTGGVFLVYKIAETVAIRPEILYSNSGGKYNYSGEYQTIALNYIQIPVLLQYTIRTEKRWEPIVMLGPAVGVNIKATDTYVLEEVDIKKGIKNIDFGALCKAGFNVDEKFEITAAYYMGFSSVDDTGNNIDVKNREIKFMLSVYF